MVKSHKNDRGSPEPAEEDFDFMDRQSLVERGVDQEAPDNLLELPLARLHLHRAWEQVIVIQIDLKMALNWSKLRQYGSKWHENALKWC